jgi:uncharacterized protein
MPPPPFAAEVSAPPSPVPHGPIGPTSGHAREPALDVLRGFALLGILLINIELMRGPLFYQVMAGSLPPPAEGIDRVVQFLSGWLAGGKFISSFAIMFGLGAALIAGRAIAAGHNPRGLLARRYGWLLLFGLAHMILLFPGDILFVYGLAGLVLLAFLNVAQRTAMIWSAALVGIVTVFGTLFAWLGALMEGAYEVADADPFTGAFTGWFADRADAAIHAHVDGSYLDVIGANAIEAAIIQGGQIFILPWVLGLFLFGFVIGRSGIIRDLAAFRPHLRKAAMIGLGAGLPLTIAQGAVDPVVMIAGSAGGQVGAGMVALVMLGQLLGAPILAVGYLSTLALLTLRFGVARPLAAVGRMALTAYLLQSLLTLIVFAGFGQYGRLGPAEAMVVILGVWVVLLIVCPLWLRWARFGPAEWLWRSLTYGRLQPLRARKDTSGPADPPVGTPRASA